MSLDLAVRGCLPYYTRWQPLTAAAWPQGPESMCAGMGCGLGWTPAPVCGTQRRCSVVLLLVVLYTCLPFAFTCVRAITNVAVDNITGRISALMYMVVQLSLACSKKLLIGDSVCDRLFQLRHYVSCHCRTSIAGAGWPPVIWATLKLGDRQLWTKN